MKVLVTGGAGFIGTNISLLFLKKKYKIVIFDSFIRNGTEKNAAILEKEGAEIIRGDIRNSYDLERVPRVEAIIHLAGNAGIPWSVENPVYDFMTNALGTLNILEYSRKNRKLPVIFASTNKVYSDELNSVPTKKITTRYVWDFNRVNRVRRSVLEGVSEEGINENFPMDSVGKYAHNPYGVSKASADLYCQEYFHTYDIPVVINRMACIFGLFQQGAEEQGWLDWFVRAKMNNLPINIFGDGKQVRDELFGADLAKLYLHQLENIDKYKGEVFNVGGGLRNSVSLLEVIDYLNTKGKKKLKVSYSDWRKNDQKINITDNTKVLRKTKWKIETSVHKGIDLMWKQYESVDHGLSLFYDLI